MNSFTEENYLKTIFNLSGSNADPVSTNAIAEMLQTKASSVTDMIKKLCDKKLLDYTRYQGVRLTEEGKKRAVMIVRRHRLWEVFLVEKLGIGWEEVHDIAEQLEHTLSEKLYEKLDSFLGHPRVDPHGDPIPDSKGKIEENPGHLLSEAAEGESFSVSGVRDHFPDFLQYLDKIRLLPGSKVTVLQKFGFDGSVLIRIGEGPEQMVSRQVADNIMVRG